MIPIVTFIGWQNSGKTTLIQKILSRLRKKGLRVAVIKSTHHQDIEFDHPSSDTDTYRKADANSVTLLAPDQMITMTARPDLKLVDIVNRSFYDFDIIVGEGFKNERHIAKIEVKRGDGEFLRDQVNGVVAVVTDQEISGENIFSPQQDQELAEFIINEFCREPDQPQTLLYVNGKKVPMKGFVQDALAGTVGGFIRTLKQTEDVRDVDLKIKFPTPPE